MDRDNQTRFFISILAIMLVILFGRMWQLQIIEYSVYNKMSKENTTRTIPSLAPRGIIYDRFGRLLVANRAIFSVYLFPSSFEEGKTDDVIRDVSRLTGVPRGKILDKINEKRSRPFEPILVKDDLSIKTVTAIEERKHNMPGVVINARPVRYYPHKKLAAHLLGYVGEITKNELNLLREKGYNLKDIIGKEGVENTYDTYLRGIDGGEDVEIDVSGRPVRSVGATDPVPGSDMKLTVDIELQELIEQNLEGLRGAMVVMDPRNGEILAMASRPSYDPAIFAAPLEKWQWDAMDKAGHPFLNRALSTYPPGSTFKVVNLSATLQEGTHSLKDLIECKGRFFLGNRVAECWKKSGHGKLDILEGLVQSCDIVFYQLGLDNGPALLSKYAKDYGLGEKTGIDLPGELPGLVPTVDWKRSVYKDVWVKGDSINYGIGQGYLIVTPLQMANVYATIATSKRYTPHVVNEVISRDGKKIFKYETKEIGSIPISKENAELLRETMRQVVKRGTGIAAEVEGIPAAGKTGTAENPGLAHAWFMCYAPYTSPEVVVVSFVEHGEHGDRVTAHIANRILRWYKDNRLNKELELSMEKDKKVNSQLKKI